MLKPCAERILRKIHHCTFRAWKRVFGHRRANKIQFTPKNFRWLFIVLCQKFYYLSCQIYKWPFCSFE